MKKIVKMFYPYLQSVCGDNAQLPKLLSKIFVKIFSNLEVSTGCFGEIKNGVIAPYKNPDFYIKMNDKTQIFIYGKPPQSNLVAIKESVFILFITSDDLSLNVKAISDRHYHMTDLSD